MSKKEKIISRIFASAAIALVVIVVGFLIIEGVQLISDLNNAVEEANEVTTKTIQLISVDYTSSAEGSFFLGCGNIGAKEYYVCYKIREDGGKVLEKLEADRTIIYDNLPEGATAYAEIDINGWGDRKEIRLYLPKDTIQVDYDLSTKS